MCRRQRQLRASQCLHETRPRGRSPRQLRAVVFNLPPLVSTQTDIGSMFRLIPPPFSSQRGCRQLTALLFNLLPMFPPRQTRVQISSHSSLVLQVGLHQLTAITLNLQGPYFVSLLPHPPGRPSLVYGGCVQTFSPCFYPDRHGVHVSSHSSLVLTSLATALHSSTFTPEPMRT